MDPTKENTEDDLPPLPDDVADAWAVVLIDICENNRGEQEANQNGGHYASASQSITELTDLSEPRHAFAPLLARLGRTWASHRAWQSEHRA